ncbi:Myb-like_DNA-binding domain-containing protein [Hexamita inflata]|uniref:Myb-like DNA-binding domain-containing protein n=1 Tax=Hexamita inflata TaxID=28002 RepID=A0AA86PSX0_9EUKA|nr:Myb-like DNA-binding domain-containing protein [Hexamita inflata]
MKQWSKEEKQKLSQLIQNYTDTRIDWINISSQLATRTPLQCKLQYRHVLHPRKYPDQTNHIWTDEESRQLMMLIKIYGHKWKYIQTNHFQHLTTEQLRMKHNQINNKRHQYKQIVQKSERGFPLTQSEAEFMQIALREINMMKQKLNNINGDCPVIIQLDPLEIKYYNQFSQQKQLEIEREELKVIELLKQFKENIEK